MHKIEPSPDTSHPESHSLVLVGKETETAQMADMEQKLYSSARFFAAEADHSFTSPCATLVRDLIRAGLNNMRDARRLASLDYDEAEANLSRLVSAMVESARKTAAIKGPSAPLFHDHAQLPKPSIREGDFVSAKRLCPIWPFC